MQAAVKKYLHFVLFSDLINWSVQYMLDTKFSYAKKYKLAEINNFSKRNKTVIDIEDDEKHKRVTIKINNGGIFLRDIERGINIGTKSAKIVFRNLSIPLPSHNLQQEIATHIQNIKTKIKTLRQTAEESRKRAITEFEQEIFE